MTRSQLIPVMISYSRYFPFQYDSFTWFKGDHRSEFLSPSRIYRKIKMVVQAGFVLVDPVIPVGDVENYKLNGTFQPVMQVHPGLLKRCVARNWLIS